MLNTVSSGINKSRLDALTYKARILALGKKIAKKRSHIMSQDSCTDLHAMSCEPSYKRQRVGLATEGTQQYICSSDGVMAPCQRSFSIPNDVYNQELAKGSQMDGSPISKEEEKVGANENGVDASHEQSSLVVQGSSKPPPAGLNSPRFREYLVPVQLTDIQLEQYCSTIITNSGLLCSSTKKGSLDPLQDALGALRKCCDHPYVLDSNLQSFRKERCPLIDYLSIGIQASGKLQLLSKFLPKIREQGLRVLILYKATSSSVKNGLGIGHILDDFICQSFGHGSYVHIYTQRYVPLKEKQAAVDLFNDKTCGRFVVLTEYSSAHHSIRLTSVDVVILFNSDLNPVNDIRALQKMSLHTENDHLRVLRLYSVCTLEEKALCLARDGSAVNSIRQFISTSTCRMLLTWGAAYLFDKLDALHASNTSESTKSLEDEFFCSVLHELSTLMSSNVDDTSTSCSSISKVNEVGEGWSGNIKLLGELEVQSLDDVPPHVIWSSLLHGRSPHWRFLSNEPESMKRRIPLWERPPEPEMSEGGLRETGLLHEEIPGWYRGTNHYAKRSKRVPGCTLGFQQRLQEIKRRWYNEISEHIKEVDETHKKRRLEKQNVEKLEHLKTTEERRESLDNMHHLENDLIPELCGESFHNLDTFMRLDDEIIFGGFCHEMNKCGENLNAAHLTARTNEEEMGLKRIESLKNSTAGTLSEDSDGAEIDAPSSSIDSRNLNTWSIHSTLFKSESVIDTLEPPIQELSPRERLNTANENGLSRDVEICTDSLPHEIPYSCCVYEEVTLKNDQTISDGQSIKESRQSVSDRFVLHDDFDIFHECLPTNEMIVAIGSDNENIYVRSVPVSVDVLSDAVTPDNLNASDSASPLSVSELGANILKKDQDLAQQNAVSCSLSSKENQGPIYGTQSSEELAVPSDTIKDFLDSLYEETLIDDEQIPQQQCIDQNHQLPLEQLPPTQLPCSEIRVTDESLPLPSCENVGNGACSQLLQSTGASLRSDTSGLFDSFLMQTDNHLMMHPTARGTEGNVQPQLSDTTGNYYLNSSSNSDVRVNSHQPASLDPLQVELEKIQNTGNIEMKKHEDMILQLLATRDKETAQISQKYASLFQDAKNDFMQKKEELKVYYEKTKAHKLLAEAWKLASDENSPIFHPTSLVQSIGMHTYTPSPYPQLANQFSHLISTDQIVSPPYPPSYQSLCNSEAGCGPYIPNRYLCPSLPTPIIPLNGFPVSQPNQHPLNFSSSGFAAAAAAAAAAQLYSSREYLYPYNISI